MRRHLLAFCSLFTLTPLAAIAQAVGDPGDVIVTARRAPETASTADVSVLGPQVLDLAPSATLADLIAQTPGVSLSRNGGPGALTSLFLRGAESAQTLLVIDGVRLSDPSAPSGAYDFSGLLAGGVDRVEILRGPQSTLWGGSAVGGVIQTLTQRASGPLSGDASLEAGSFGAVSETLRLGAGDGRGDIRFDGQLFTTDGISNLDRRAGGLINDAASSGAFSLRGDYDVLPGLSLDLRLRHAQSRSNYDGYFPDFSFGYTGEDQKTLQTSLYAGIRSVTLDGKLTQHLGASYAEVASRDFNPQDALETPVAPVLEFDSKGQTRGLEYQGDYSFDKGLSAVFGVEQFRSRLWQTSPSAYDPNPAAFIADADTVGAYGRLDAKLGEALSVNAGLRYEHHSAFGGAWLGQIGARYQLDPDTVIKSNIGQGFTAPSLYQLFSPYGTPNLHPEHTLGGDLGVERRWLSGRLVTELTGFISQSRDGVDYIDCYSVITAQCNIQPYGYYANIDRSEAKGYEAAARYALLPNLSLTAQLGALDDRNTDRASLDYKLHLARRPSQTGGAGLSWNPFGKLQTGLSWRHVGASYNDAGDTGVLKSYDLASAFITSPIAYGVTGTVRIENALNQHYETAMNYGSAPRGFYASLRKAF